MLKRIENTVIYYMIVFLPLLFSIGRFVPIVETLVTLFTLLILVIDQCALRHNIVKYFAITVLFFVSGLMGSEYTQHIDHIKPMIIFFLAMDARDSDLYIRAIGYIKKYHNFILGQLVVVLMANLAFAFLNEGYSTSYSESWSLNAFQGIYSDPHQCAYHICALLVILLWIGRIKFKTYYYWILIGFEYCVLLTGARVPTVLSLFLGLIFLVDHFIKPYSITDFIQKFSRYCVILILLAVALYFVINWTSFGAKMLESIVSGNLDNGRSSLRERDLALFMGSDFLHKLFGHGTDAILAYHGSFSYSPAIWSHNDFFQILVGMGFLMFLIYTYYWIRELKNSIHESILSVALIAILMGVAFLNGLYIHTRFTFVMPLLFIYMSGRKGKQQHVLNT